MLQERLVRHRHPARHHRAHRIGVDPDLVLRVRVGAQAQEVHQVVQVGLPIPLGIGGERQVDARQLAGEAVACRVAALPGLVLVQHPAVVGMRALAVGAQQRQHLRRLLGPERLAAALAVDGGLRLQLSELRHVELAVEHGVARRHLVDAGGAMPDPLPRHEDRQFHVKLDRRHLEGRRMPVPQEVVDQPAILAHLAGAAAVGHARRLHYRRVVAHVVDHAEEAVVEQRHWLEENLLQRRHGRPQRRGAVVSRLADLSFLGVAEEHNSDRQTLRCDQRCRSKI